MRRIVRLELVFCVLLAGLALAGCGTRTSDCPVGESGCACASGDRCFDGLTCASGTCAAPLAPGVDGGGVPPIDAGPAPSACDACRSDQACVEGACVDPPAMCPCPAETYCDLAAGRCLLGCTSDEGCDPARARICDAATRSCVDGCRDDTGCPAGQICDAETCRAGCRDDATCGAGQICEGSVCRAGCRGDATCGAGQICEGLACRPGCRGDGDCPGASDVCDLASATCRAGCRGDGDCPTEQICDTGAALCTPGCRDSTGCHPGRSCLDAACVCPTGLTACGAECVDVTTSDAHCGACDNECVGSGSECRESACFDLRPTSGQYAACDEHADCSSDAPACMRLEDLDGTIRGFCSVACAGGEPTNCDPAPSGSAVPGCFGTGTSYCALDCGSFGTCPPGMRCFPFSGGGGYCF